jgi:hypothetical protein
VIGRLKGIIVHKQPPWLVVDVHGVGYELEAPMSTFYDLPELGREVALFTHYAQKEDSVSLYGFLREAERRLFRDVQRVSGIGAKIALAVLSGVPVEEFARLVQASARRPPNAWWWNCATAPPTWPAPAPPSPAPACRPIRRAKPPSPCSNWATNRSRPRAWRAKRPPPATMPPPSSAKR